MAKAYGYTRFSEARQIFGESIKRQKDLIKQWQQNNPQHEVEEISDYGVSGFTGDNLDAKKSNLGKFLKRLEENEIEKGSFLLLEKLDRLGRIDYQDLWEVFRNISKYGITIVVLDQNRTLTQDDVAKIGTMIEVVAGFYAANAESQKKSDRLKKTWDIKRDNITHKQKLTGSCPDWLDPITEKITEKHRKTTEFVVNKEKAKTVKQLFQLYCDRDWSIRSLVTYLNENLPTITKKRYKWRWNEETEKAEVEREIPRIWTISYVAQLLKDRRVLGEFSPKSKRVKLYDPINDYYPQIIDENTFNAVQFKLIKRRNTRGPKKKNINLFVKLLENTYGDTYQLVTTVDKGIKRRRLYSYAHYQSNVNNKERRITLHYDYFARFILDAVKIPRIEVTPTQTNITKRVVLQQQIDTLTRVMSTTSNEITLTQIVKQIDRARKSLSELEEIRQEVSREDLDYIQNIGEDLNYQQLERLQTILPTIIRKIVINPRFVERSGYPVFEGVIFLVNGTQVVFVFGRPLKREHIKIYEKNNGRYRKSIFDKNGSLVGVSQKCGEALLADILLSTSLTDLQLKLLNEPDNEDRHEVPTEKQITWIVKRLNAPAYRENIDKILNDNIHLMQ